MGVFAEYLDKGFGGDAKRVLAERKKQLERITAIRGRDVLVFAAAFNKNPKLPIAINYTDLLPLTDQLSNLENSGNKGLDLILETPGGSGETVEDIVKLIRARYESFGVIVPGMAKSAGTILAMAADEILMEGVSALGPIDAQLSQQGKQFSAHALIEGMQKIKDEVTAQGSLNRAYVPMLQTISPGELQHAANALEFAQELVRNWLVTYKFKDWSIHSSTGLPVTDEDRRQRAIEIAGKLCNHGLWKTHGRSIKMDDLRQMRLLITDYAEHHDLRDAIRRYHTLTQMTFATNVYKIYETKSSQIVKMEAVQTNQIVMPAGVGPFAQGGLPANQLASADQAMMSTTCNKCGTIFGVQARFTPKAAVNKTAIQFPANNLLKCPGPGCDAVHDLAPMRQQLEAQTKKKIL